MADVSGEIERLAELHRSGALSDEEFATAKAAVLANPAALQGGGETPPDPGGSVAGFAPGQPAPPKAKRTSPAAWGCLILIIVVVAGFVIVSASGGNKSSPSTTRATTQPTQVPTRIPTQSPTPSFDEVKAAAKTLPYDQLEKDASSLRGTWVYYDAKIFQFDSNTGPNSFLAEVEKGKYDIWDGLVMVSVAAGAPGIDKDDLIRMWAKVEGAESYTTGMGASKTVPKLTAVKVELVKKQ